MKHNLKNRVNWTKMAIVGKKPIDLMEAYEEWFRGFQKEIEEKLKECMKLEELWGEPLAEGETLRDILGEASSG